MLVSHDFLHRPNDPTFPAGGHAVHFTPLADMIVGHPEKTFTPPKEAFPGPMGPVDWSKSGGLSFPMYGNDRYGDCVYAAACHADQTYMACHGPESSFDTQTVINSYLALSGGDNGLYESQILGEWHKGLCGNKSATILDSLNVNVLDVNSVVPALHGYLAVVLFMGLPDAWFYRPFHTGDIWDAPAVANWNRGHAVLINGVDSLGMYRAWTWGTWVWITPVGLASCAPYGFVAFSMRQYSPLGYTGSHVYYTQAAATWHQAGGFVPPPNPFPPPASPKE
jgi:hypothetical protein